MQTMLISVTTGGRLPGGLRILLLENNRLCHMDIEHTKERIKGNVYYGVVESVENSLNAAFVNFGEKRHGFLPFKEISDDYLKGTLPQDGTDVKINDVVEVGQKMLIQVQKEPRGNKGAGLTNFISTAGTSIVLMPKSPDAGGISRRVMGEERASLRENLSKLPVPEAMSLIVRTAGIHCSYEALEADLHSLLAQWDAIQKSIETLSAPQLIHQENDMLLRTVRDHLSDKVQAIIVDDKQVFDKMQQYLQHLKPQLYDKLKYYQEETPLFVHHKIQHEIESVYQREVSLPSGGSIAIDHTEALIAIDVNSRKATKENNIEMTAFSTNVEACEEIARQLRLRDLGGLFAIDFIDMKSAAHRRQVEEKFAQMVRFDRARIQTEKISARLGLMIGSRQRLHSSFGESNQQMCPRCGGCGTIQNIEALALAMLRLLEEETLDGRPTQIHAYLPLEVSTYLTNEKHTDITSIQQRQNVKIFIIPDPQMQTPHYKIKKFKIEDGGTQSKSYTLLPSQTVDVDEDLLRLDHLRDRPAVEAVLERQKAPPHQTGALIRLFRSVVKRLVKPTHHVAKTASSQHNHTKKASAKQSTNQRRRTGNREGRTHRGYQAKNGQTANESTQTQSGKNPTKQPDTTSRGRERPGGRHTTRNTQQRPANPATKDKDNPS